MLTIARIAGAWAISTAALALTVCTHPGSAGVPLDFSYEVALVDKLDRSEWAGRDFFFTYGPFTQLAYASSGLLRSGSPIDRAALSYVTMGATALGVLALNVVLTPGIRPASATLLFFTFALFLNFSFDRWNLLLRGYATLLPSLLLLIALTRDRFHSRYFWTGVASLGCFTAQLVSFDAGLFSTAACAGALIVVGLLSASGVTKGLFGVYHAGLMLATLLGTTAAANLLLAIVFWSTAQRPIGLTDYHHYNWRLAEAYNAAFGAAWDLGPLLATLLVGMGTYVCVAMAVNWRKWSWEQQALCLTIGLLALVNFKGAVVRSGEPKILASCLPLIYLAAVLALGEESPRWTRRVGIVVLVMLVCAWPFRTGFAAIDLLTRAVGEGWQGRDRWAPLISHQVASSEIVPPQIAQELAPHTRLLPFPYHNLLPIALGRPHVSPTLQAYAAIDLESQQHFVTHASRVQDDMEVIYAIDELAAGQIDLVPNVTRSPVIFDYIQGLFAPKTGIIHPPGYVVLALRAQPISLPRRPVAFSAQRSGGVLTLRLARAEACNLLKVKARIAYPFIAALGRPQPLSVSMQYRGSLVRQHRLVTLDMNHAFETYLLLNRGEPFVHVLEWPDMREPLPMPLVDEVQIEAVTLGLFDVAPSEVDVQRIECVALDMLDNASSLQPNYSATVGPLMGGQPVRQEFETVRDGTTGISVFLGTYARVDTGPVTFSVVARDAGSEEVLVTIRKDATDVTNNDWLTLTFSAQPAGRKLAVVAEAPTNTQSNITVFYASGDPYPAGQLRIAERPIDGDLTLRFQDRP